MHMMTLSCAPKTVHSLSFTAITSPANKLPKLFIQLCYSLVYFKFATLVYIARRVNFSDVKIIFNISVAVDSCMFKLVNYGLPW